MAVKQKCVANQKKKKSFKLVCPPTIFSSTDRMLTNSKKYEKYVKYTKIGSLEPNDKIASSRT